nr:ankyrin repeat domain-containing protein [Deltaproteobacteria bacterium]
MPLFSHARRFPRQPLWVAPGRLAGLFRPGAHVQTRLKAMGWVVCLTGGLWFTGCADLPPLTRAVEDNRIAQAEDMVRRGADVDEKDKHQGRTPLMAAAILGREEITRMLLKHKADPNLSDMDGQTALILAVRSGQGGAVRLLLAAGAQPNAKSITGNTALHWAALTNPPAEPRPQQPVRPQYPAAGINPKDGGNPGEALPEPETWSQLQMVQQLLAAGADPKARNQAGNTPLMSAAEGGKPEVMALLLDSGTPVNARNTLGMTALAWAALKGHEAGVRLLLGRGASPDLHGGMGETPLMLASAAGYEGVVQALLDHHAQPALRNRRGDTALSLARQRGHTGIQNLLRHAGAKE